MFHFNPAFLWVCVIRIQGLLNYSIHIPPPYFSICFVHMVGQLITPLINPFNANSNPN